MAAAWPRGGAQRLQTEQEGAGACNNERHMAAWQTPQCVPVYMSLGVTTNSLKPAEHKLVMRTFVFWEARRIQT